MAEVVFDQTPLVLDFLGATEMPIVATWLVEANPLSLEKPYAPFDIQAQLYNPNDVAFSLVNLRVVASNPDTLASADHVTTIGIPAGGTSVLTITVAPKSGLGKANVSLTLAADRA